MGDPWRYEKNSDCPLKLLGRRQRIEIVTFGSTRYAFTNPTIESEITR
jgi:hypothetical protein